MQKINTLKIGAVLSYFSIGLNMLAGVLYTPWMIRQIGQSQYGIYTLANSIITLMMFDFGLSSATARYVSNYHAKGDEKGVSTFLGTIYKLYLIVDIIIFLVLLGIFLFIETIYSTLTPIEIQQFKVAYIIVGLYSIISFPFVTLNGILTAYEKFVQIKIADIIYRVLVVTFMVIALQLHAGLYALVAVNAVVGIIVIIYKIAVIRRTTNVHVDFSSNDKTVFREIATYSIWLTVYSLAQRLVFNITPSILGAVANSSAIAVFGIVSTIESYTYLISTALNGMFMPKVSRIYEGVENEKSVMPLLLNVGKFQYFVNGSIAVGFLIFGKEFIFLWAGQDFLDAYVCISLVIIPGVFYNSLQIAHTTMIVENKVKQLAFINLAMGVANLLLSLYMSSQFGVVGASVSIFIAYWIRFVLVLIVYPKSIKISTGIFLKECVIRLLPQTIICVGVGLILNIIIPNYSWLGLILKCSCFSIIALICAGLYIKGRKISYE